VLDRLGTGGRHEHLLVNGKTGRPYTSIHKVWRRLRAEAGLPHLRIHDLRHQYASFLVNAGRTLYEVQNILGHSDPSVTQCYAHLSTRSLQEAADSAAEAIGGARKGLAAGG
jgi:site-specific recombinase XerD